MSIIIAFFVGICFATLADSVADYISACAQRIEAQAEALKLENKSKKLELDKKANTTEPQQE
ncbi:MAG: hypothetical protein IJ859_01390 [Synergistaceae bacterium]|nr:hypothetical protein [Synergistaceae bacterium]